MNNLSRILDEIIKEYPDLTVTQLRLVLLVSQNENKPFAFFVNTPNIPRTSLAKIFRYLAGWRHNQSRTEGLLTITKDGLERTIALSDKGQKLLDKLFHIN